MMRSIHRDVKAVLEETSLAYQTFADYDSMNADFANFAAMVLSQFKDALRTPELTQADLERMIRSGMARHRQAPPGADWTTFMASYVTTAVNEEGRL